MAKDTNRRGPDSTYDEARATEICEKLANGIPLAEICRADHMPSRQTVHNWRAEDNEFSLRFAGAREDGWDRIAYGSRKVARGEGESTGDVQRDKLIIDTDLKLLAKWDPKRYGDKLEAKVEHSGSVSWTNILSEIHTSKLPSDDS